MDFEFLTNTPLFRGADAKAAEAMLACLGSSQREYEKGEVIFSAGESAGRMGMPLSGSVNIELDDLWGNKTILNHVEAGGLFAETYACIPDEPMLVSAVACEKCRVLFLDAERLLTAGGNSCEHRNRLIANLLRILAEKNLALSRRSLYTAPKSIRGRLLSYLSAEAKRHGSYRFAIPFNRQQLADYLGVDRSALSKELGRMRSEGLLTYDKNRFELSSGQNNL